MRDRAIQRRHFDVAAQCCLAEGDRHPADQVAAVAMEEGVFLDADEAVEVAARSARIAGLPLAVQPYAIAAIDSWRNRDLDLPFHHDPAMPLALGAVIGDDLASSAAGATGLLHAEVALAQQDCALAIAFAAGLWRRPLLGTAAAAFAAQLFAGNGEGLLGAPGSLDQVDGHFDFQVPAAARAMPPAAATAKE